MKVILIIPANKIRDQSPAGHPGALSTSVSLTPALSLYVLHSANHMPFHVSGHLSCLHTLLLHLDCPFLQPILVLLNL